MRKQFKYTTRFESYASCATDKEIDKYLAIASSKAIQNLLPKDIDLDVNYDLLAFAGNGAIINRANKNSHIIDSKTAVAINKHFKYKPMDLAHSRKNIVGCVLTTGFTTYGTNEEMSEEDCLACEGPFNIALGGLVYRIANPEFAEMLEENSNPESENYQTIFLSWELGYQDYNILVGSPNLSEGEVIKSGSPKFDELSKKLKAKGGNNRLDDGTPIYQYIFGEETQPLAYGFTQQPAANVTPVITASEEIQKNINNNEEISSQQQNPIVINNDMKKNIKNLDEIYALNDEGLKEVSASSIAETIKEAIKASSKVWEAKVEAEKNAGSLAKETAESLKTSVAELKSEIKEISKAQASERALNDFNTRMSLVDSEYNLDDGDRTSIASDIKGLDEEGFGKWFTSFAKYAKDKKKTDTKDDDTDEAKAAKAKKAAKADDDEEAIAAKKKESKAEVLAAVEEALKTAQTKGFLVGNNVDFGFGDLKEKYKGSFGKEGIVLKK